MIHFLNGDKNNLKVVIISKLIHVLKSIIKKLFNFIIIILFHYFLFKHSSKCKVNLIPNPSLISHSNHFKSGKSFLFKCFDFILQTNQIYAISVISLDYLDLIDQNYLKLTEILYRFIYFNMTLITKIFILLP